MDSKSCLRSIRFLSEAVRGSRGYPGHIDQILSNTKSVGSEYQIHLSRGTDGKDYLMIRVERQQGGDPAGDAAVVSSLQGEIKKQMLVSGRVEVVDYGTLPRSERKSKRVFDHRDL